MADFDVASSWTLHVGPAVGDPAQRGAGQAVRRYLLGYCLLRGALGPVGALFPLPRPARTIVALVRFTASRSAVSAMWA